MEWKLITTDNCKKVNTAEQFFLGNGYLFSYGAEEEYCQSMIPAQSLAGILYVGEDGWRTFSRTPNPFYTSIFLEKEAYTIWTPKKHAHRKELDCRNGILYRETVWDTGRGKLSIASERFLSRNHFHAALMRYRIQTDFDGELWLQSGIDISTQENDGYEYEEVRGAAGAPVVLKALDKRHTLSMMETSLLSEQCSQWTTQSQGRFVQNMKFCVKAGREYVLTKFVTEYLRRDTELYDIKNAALMEEMLAEGYEQERAAHCEGWNRLWEQEEDCIRLPETEELESRLMHSRYLIKCVKGRETYEV